MVTTPNKRNDKMICKIDDLQVENGYNNRVRVTPTGIAGRLHLWLCEKRGNHDFEIVLEEWFDKNVTYDDWVSGTHIKDVEPVSLKEATRWCARHTILRCNRCGFEWERLAGGVKGCGAHTWIAGREWAVGWQCLPWGDPDATVKVGTSPIPSSVMQINDVKLNHLKDIRV